MKPQNDDQLIMCESLDNVERATLLLEPIRYRQTTGGLSLHEQAQLEAAHDILMQVVERLEEARGGWRLDNADAG
ncbi:hypothetical protein [Modicisalibacter radicis]|uniref:hypothetical protein n=1 Tax=Halomonas sp. EAR18 TaxID=2518972 RepID=UPI00109C005E|nr:hypothetical protein [Halomonas sp. EAR18]